MKSVERLDPFNPQRFVDEFWRRRPCLIGNWIRPEPLALDDLLGAAGNEGLPMRLVTGSQQRADWTLTHGPLESDDLPAEPRDWTVLVQEMDKSGRQVEFVLDEFRRFLPDWLLDDIMISHAMPGGSVGAHVDAYDVFLVQVAGTRCWQLAEDFNQALDQRFEQALLRHWQPQTELRVSPGETLYLPPGIAHHGVAEDECQTWSVGSRTPSGPELMFFLAESLTLAERGDDRLEVARPDPSVPARITPQLAGQARALMKASLELDDADLASLLARFLTRWRLWPREAGTAELEDIAKVMREERSIRLDGATRLALHGAEADLSLTVNGEHIPCPSELALELATTRHLTPAWLEFPDALEQLLELGAISGH